MKRKNRKAIFKNRRIFYLLVFIILLVLIVISIIPKNKNSLDKLGYSNLEIVEINKLTKSEIDTISKYDYNSNLIYIIKSENYNPNKLNLYMKYTLKYKGLDYLKIFELINNDNFKENKIDEYIELLKKYDSPNGIVNYVNNYKGKDIEANETTLALLNEKYFIEEYLDRYIKYYNKNNKLGYDEIVRRVNSNIDKEFYTDSNKADTSKGMYTLVNKFYYLEENFTPEDIVSTEPKYSRDTAKLNKTAYENFVKMADAANKDGLTIKITTAYRNYNFQSILYNNYVKSDGVKAADTYSARPGYSEHQLGYSADLTNGKNVSFDDFETTKEFEWLSENAYKYGFILRFPKGKDYLTGYKYESWHYRYVGKEIAKYIYENDITYEEYYAYFLR